MTKIFYLQRDFTYLIFYSITTPWLKFSKYRIHLQWRSGIQTKFDFSEKVWLLWIMITILSIAIGTRLAHESQVILTDSLCQIILVFFIYISLRFILYIYFLRDPLKDCELVVGCERPGFIFLMITHLPTFNTPWALRVVLAQVT